MDSIKILCTICARGGSKGVANKNLRIINKKPLIAHSIFQAKETKLFTAIAVSSDSDEILQTSKEWGADIIIKRPEHMATDTAAKLPVIQHAVLEAESILNITHDICVDLDATSPLRLPSDIIGAVNLLKESKVSNIITGSSARRSPYFNLVEENEEGFVKLAKQANNRVVRRQDAPKCFDMNASIYVWKRDILIDDPKVFYSDTKIFEMPEERSLDIDSPLDFDIVRFLMEKTNL
jgi:N-acylneuraminate cytidylyltransferase/CMP-N,N'-diacetyllegionaminic acid synthase